MTVRSLARALAVLALLAPVVGPLAVAPTAQAQFVDSCRNVCTCASSCDMPCQELEIICPNNQKPCDLNWYPSTCGWHGVCSGSASCQSASATSETTALESFFATTCDAPTAIPTVAF